MSATKTLSGLRIAVGVLFLFLSEYKVFGTQFTPFNLQSQESFGPYALTGSEQFGERLVPVFIDRGSFFGKLASKQQGLPDLAGQWLFSFARKPGLRTGSSPSRLGARFDNFSRSLPSFGSHALLPVLRCPGRTTGGLSSRVTAISRSCSGDCAR
jgi:hypothetical protein